MTYLGRGRILEIEAIWDVGMNDGPQNSDCEEYREGFLSVALSLIFWNKKSNTLKRRNVEFAINYICCQGKLCTHYALQDVQARCKVIIRNSASIIATALTGITGVGFMVDKLMGHMP